MPDHSTRLLNIHVGRYQHYPWDMAEEDIYPVCFKPLNDALNVAIDTGDASALRKALASGADISQWVRTAAESAVRFALMSNSTVEVLEILREAGLDMAGRSPEHEEAGEPFPRVDRLLSQALM